MAPDSFLETIAKKLPPASAADVSAFELSLGCRLPEDYREFLIACNGGFVGGTLWFKGLTPTGEPADAGVHHIGGFRQESHFSLVWHRECYEGRIPNDLLWIMDDPFGNAICLGIEGAHFGMVFFWNHKIEPDDEWDGTVEKAGNLQLLANSFSDFVAGLQRHEGDA